MVAVKNKLVKNLVIDLNAQNLEFVKIAGDVAGCQLKIHMTVCVCIVKASLLLKKIIKLYTYKTRSAL